MCVGCFGKTPNVVSFFKKEEEEECSVCSVLFGAFVPPKGAALPYFCFLASADRLPASDLARRNAHRSSAPEQ